MVVSDFGLPITRYILFDLERANAQLRVKCQLPGVPSVGNLEGDWGKDMGATTRSRNIPQIFGGNHACFFKGGSNSVCARGPSAEER